MEQKSDNPNEMKILQAAKKVFHKHGYDGARMQEIADEAGINKAMLHYYFRSKDKLFDAIFEEAVYKIFFMVGNILDSDAPFNKKMENFANAYISILQENPFLPAFILHELNNNGEKLQQVFKNKFAAKPMQFMAQIKQELDANGMSEIDPRHFIVNLLSMCLFPFAAKPIIKMNLGFTEEDYLKFIEDRKKLVPEFVLSSMKKP